MSALPLVLGIDFGTSNSAAAYVDAAGQLQVIPLERDRSEMPTAVFFATETQHVLFGQDAMTAYLSDVEGRLLRSLKSLLGSALMEEHTAVGDRSMRYFDIVVLFFKELKRRCELHLGRSVQHAMLGRPVHFVDDNPERDTLAQETLGRAAREAGFIEVSYQLEPIAAALDYERRISAPARVLVVDIGGGTSDFSLLTLNPQRNAVADRASDVQATTGIHIGGTDFDRLLDLDTVMPLLGYRHQGPSGRPVPSGLFFDLSTWHLIHQSYGRKALHFARELWTDYADLQLHRRLMSVLEGQYGHRILARVEQAKIACSVHATDAAVALEFLEANLAPVLTPEQLQEAVRSAVQNIVQCAQHCVAAADGATLDAVYLTGGSSALRPLVTALRQAMPDARLIEGNRFGGVAAGLAVAGANWAPTLQASCASQASINSAANRNPATA